MAVYYVWSGAAGSGSGADWTNAKTTLTAAFVTEAAGDTLYVAHDHAESTAGGITLTSSGTQANPTKVVCVNRAGSVPPVSADRRATATVSTTGSGNNISIAAFTHYDGIIFNAGNGASGSANITVTQAANLWQRFDNCSFRFPITGSGSGGLSVGGTSGGSYLELNNTTMSFAHNSNSVGLQSRMVWRNTPSALLGTMPSTLFKSTTNSGGAVECSGVDLSAASSSTTLVDVSGSSKANAYTFVDCKLDASVVKTSTVVQSSEVDFVRSGSTGNYAVSRHRTAGVLTEETTIVRTGGASDGTTTIAWKIVTTVNISWSTPFEAPAIAIWNDTIGSSVTATVEGIWGGGAVPNDDEIWLDVEYLSDASSPQAAFVNDGKANLLATAAAQTSSSETWGGSTTKFKLHVSFTAQQKGWIYARVKCAKASSTFYIDPLVTLT